MPQTESQRSESEERVRPHAEAAARAIGCQLLDLAVRTAPGRLKVEVTVDRPGGPASGGPTVEDCARVSRALSQALEDGAVLEMAYTLEVSSPGLTRPLTRAEEFDHFRDRLVLLQTRAAIEGRNRFRGRLQGLTDEGRAVAVEDQELGRTVAVPREAIAWARLDFDVAAEPAPARRARRRA